MSDLYSKTTAIRQILATPEGAEKSNSEIARVVGCESSTVRKVRAEMETEALRDENARLRAENKALSDELAKLSKLPGQLAELATQPAAPARQQARRRRDDSRPLFEGTDSAGQIQMKVGTIELGCR